jgi:uncharacterized protein YjbI with pentapeptide repeats
MQYITIKNLSGNALFSGTYKSFRHALETAIKQSINLTAADLRYQNLSIANLDGAFMPHADFTGSNLSGANLSECNLLNAIFIHADLTETCFTDSILDEAKSRPIRRTTQNLT